MRGIARILRAISRLRPLWRATALRGCGALWFARHQLQRRGAVVVLLLHRVLDEADWGQTRSVRAMLVRSRTFEDLAIHLARNFEMVPLTKAAPGKPGAKVKVAVTFDDGWRDTFTTALPVVLACGIPATVFICTALTSCIAPFWPERMMAALRAIKTGGTLEEAEIFIAHLQRYSPQERSRWIEDLARTLGAEDAHSAPFEGDCTMTWDDVAEMDLAGVTFGSHTHTHRILAAVGPGGVRKEIRESRTAIERKLSKRCELFAYPDGSWSHEARRILAEEGFRLAFTNEWSAWTAECDPLLIPRVAISENDLAGVGGRFSPAMFEYNVFWKTWRELRAKARQPAVTGFQEQAAA